MSTPAGWELVPAPTWPPPPEGWSPPPGWAPDPGWKAPPRGWTTWRPGASGAVQPAAAESKDLTWAEPLGPPRSDRVARVEILVVLSVFPLSALVTALVLLLRNVVEGTKPKQISKVFAHHDALSSVFGGVLYLSSAGSIAIALFLLWSSGIPLRGIGLRRDGLGRDLANAVGLVAVGYLVVFAYGLFTEAVGGLPGTVATDRTHLAAIFIIQGVMISIGTAWVEETVINAYLLTRFSQLGWSPRKALWVSMALRTSYHAYYGVGLILTMPVGYLLTRSFQKHRRLVRVVAAHALYDGLLFVLAILVS